MSNLFGFQSLDVYQRSIEFLALVTDIIDGFPPRQGAIADQLRRAALSIPLNIAEGAGRTGEREIRRHRAIARGSAMECAAILDVLAVLKICEPERLELGRDLLLRIVQMLTKLCR